MYHHTIRLVSLILGIDTNMLVYFFLRCRNSLYTEQTYNLLPSISHEI